MIATFNHAGRQRKIDIHDPEQVHFWCSELNCTKEHLVYCVMKVGNSSRAVKDFWYMNSDRLKAFFHMIWEEVKHEN